MVTRAIHFYRASIGRDAAHRLIPFNVRPHLSEIDELSWETGDRYLDSGDGVDIACWLRRTRGRPRMIFANVRRSGLPQIEEFGELTAMPLTGRQGISDAIHVVFFADGIVGCDFNFYGPRPSRAGWYLRERTSAPDSLSFERLAHPDVIDQLRRLEGLRLFTLRVSRADIDALASVDQSLHDAFAAAARVGDAPEIEVTARVEGHAREVLDEQFQALSERLLRAPGIAHLARTLKVVGVDPDTSRATEINLLSDALVSRRQVLRENAEDRAIDPRSAFAAIEESFEQLQDLLRRAASVQASSPFDLEAQ